MQGTDLVYKQDKEKQHKSSRNGVLEEMLLEHNGQSEEWHQGKNGNLYVGILWWEYTGNNQREKTKMVRSYKKQL